jgi:hypothetical protein
MNDHPEDYRCESFNDACIRAGHMAKGGWHSYVVKREEIRGKEEFATVTSYQWRDAKRYGWTRVLEVSNQICDVADAA